MRKRGLRYIKEVKVGVNCGVRVIGKKGVGLVESTPPSCDELEINGNS